MLQLFEFTFTALGGPCEFRLYANSKKQANQTHIALQSEVRRIEKKYSRYDPNSVVSRVNQSAGTDKPVAIDEETAGLLHYADQMFDQSEGLFDPTSGVLRRAWNFKSGKLPSQEELDALLPIINWKLVNFDRERVALTKPGMEIDFGGFGKEFTTDLCAVKAQNCGIEHGLINLGGDIRVIGPHPNGEPWIVGIQNPRNPTSKQEIARVNLHKGAIATSGDYERFMILDGIRYCHLLNPKTGMSIQPAFSSVSVLADSCLIAGSFSTLGMLNSPSKPNWIEQAGLPYLCIDQKLSIRGSISNQTTE